MYGKYFKRLLDIVVSICALPFVLLAVLVMAPVIWLMDHGPVFYNAPRMGLGGRHFKMYKLRSMYVHAPDLRNPDGSTFNATDDPRVTAVGRFMRETSIDELPQIFNVLKGDMSIVGPRPTLPSEPNGDERVFHKRLSVRPGITGYSQAYYRNAIGQDEKFALDCEYVDRLSFLFDMKILVRTVTSMLHRENIYVKK